MDNDSDLLTELVLGSARGARKRPLEYELIRELNGADHAVLLNPPNLSSVTPQIQKIRHSHHTLARCLADGMKASEINLITGYSASRISILQGDPAFRELVAYYAEQKEAVYLDVHERLAALGLNTIDELRDRLEADPDSFSKRELMELSTLCLDRSSAPPKTKAGAGGPVAAPAIGSITIKLVQAQNPGDQALTGPGPLIEISSNPVEGE